MSSHSSSNMHKVAIIGCGRVGMSTGFALLLDGIADEIVLVGRDKSKLRGEQLDLEHGLSFLSPTKIVATDNYQDIADTDVVIVTAGASQKPGETRLDLVEKNTNIIESIIPRVTKYAPNAIIVIVSNPVDILTYKAYLAAGLPKGRVFGSGTMLDTSRFRFHLSEIFNVHPRSIHAYVLGEHGDSSFPVTSHATIGGKTLSTFSHFSQQKIDAAYKKTRDAAYTIIQSKGSTYYAIAVGVVNLVRKILKDSRSVVPVSIPLHGQYGHTGVSISVPCIIGKNGVEEILETKLSWEEKEKLAKSVDQLKEYL